MTRRLATLLGAIALAPVLVLGMACSEDDGGSNDGVALEDREDFEQDVNARLQDLDREISELEGRIEQQGGNAEEDLDQRLDELKDERVELNDRLDDLRNASDDDWDNVRDDIQDSLDDLDRRIEDF